MRGVADSGAFLPASDLVAGGPSIAVPHAASGRRNARPVARARPADPPQCSRRKHWSIVGGSAAAAIGIGYQSGAVELAVGAVSKLGVENTVMLVLVGLVFQLPILGFLFWFVERQRRSEAELNRQINQIWRDVLLENKEAMTQVAGKLASFEERVGTLLATLERVLTALNARRSPR